MKYPFPKTSRAERKLLDAIGVGNYALAGVFVRNLSKHLDRLTAEGWIRQCGVKEICNDRFGVVAIPEFEMQINWHMRWCEYQSTKDSEQ